VTFPERLRGGDPIVAAFSLIASPVVAELLARAGFDAIVFDTEHGPLGPEALNVLIPAARAAGIAPIVRVRQNDPTLIGAALDVGAAGVLVPQVGSAEAAVAAVSAGRFGPGGHRGSNPYVRAAGYHAAREWFARANDDSAMIVMIEGEAGLAALPQILETPQLDGIFIGPFDLAHALGVPGEIEHPTVLRKIEEIVRAAAAKSIATGVFAPTPPLARRWIDLGVRFVALGFDTALILQGFREVRDQVRS
jgi:4-hydroxy-2-oxoheptanedioate aldolase